MTTNLILAAIIATTTVISFYSLRRLWWMRCMFNQHQELPTVFHDSFFLGLVSFAWFQVLFLSTAFELVRGSSLAVLHMLGMTAQILALNVAVTLRVCSAPYVLNMDTIRALKVLRDAKAERRNNAART